MLGSIGGGRGTSVGVLENGLVHRWKFDENSGSVAFDDVGDLHLNLYTGVAMDPAGSSYADTTALVAASWFDGASNLFACFVAEYEATAGQQTIVGGDASAAYFRVYVSAGGALVVSVVTGSTPSTVYVTGPTLTDGKVVEAAVAVDLSTETATFYTREHTDGDTFSGEWTETTGSWNASPAGTALTKSNGSDKLRLLAGGASNGAAESFWQGRVSLVGAGAGMASASDLKAVLARPCRVIASSVMGSSAGLWLFEFGENATVLDVLDTTYANTLTFSGSPSWDNALHGWPQQGLRRGARYGGSPGVTICGPHNGVSAPRTEQYIHGAGFAMPDILGATRTEAFTVEVLARVGYTGETSLKCLFRSLDNVGAEGGFKEGVEFEMNSNTGGYNFYDKSYSAQSESRISSSIGLSTRKFVMRCRPSADRHLIHSTMRLQDTELPTFNAVAGASGVNAEHTSAWDNRSYLSAAYSTQIGRPDTNAGDITILEVRVYDRELSDAEIEQNHAADRARFSGHTWVVDAKAPVNGNGTREAPFNDVTYALRRVNYGDAIDLNGICEVDAADGAFGTLCQCLQGWSMTGSGTLKRVTDNSGSTIDLTHASTKPVQNLYFGGLTIDANNKATRGATIAVSDKVGGVSSGVAFVGCTVKNTYDHDANSNADGIKGSIPGVRVIRCTFDYLRAHAVYFNPNDTEDLTGCVMAECVVQNANLADWGDGAGSCSIIQTWRANTPTQDPYLVIKPLVYNNRCMDYTLTSGLVMCACDGGEVFNNVVTMDSVGIGGRVGYTNTQPTNDLLMANNLFAGGSTGLICDGSVENASGNRVVNNVFRGFTTDIAYGSDTEIRFTTANTVEYNAGESGDLPAGDGNIPSGTIALVNESGTTLGDFALTVASSGYKAGTELESYNRKLLTDVAGVRRPSSGWSMGALA